MMKYLIALIITITFSTNVSSLEILAKDPNGHQLAEILREGQIIKSYLVKENGLSIPNEELHLWIRHDGKMYRCETYYEKYYRVQFDCWDQRTTFDQIVRTSRATTW